VKREEPLRIWRGKRRKIRRKESSNGKRKRNGSGKKKPMTFPQLVRIRVQQIEDRAFGKRGIMVFEA